MQTSYDNQKPFLLGMIYSLANKKVSSFAAEEAITFGRYVSRGTSPEKEVLLPSAAGDITSKKVGMGVALHDHARESVNDGLAPGYKALQTVSVMEKGEVVVEVEADVMLSSDVYVRHASVAQADKVLIDDVQNATDYIVNINGSDYKFTSDADATDIEIRDGLIVLLDAISGISATSDGTNGVAVSATVAGESYTISVSAEMSVTSVTSAKLGELGIFAPATGAGLSALANARWKTASQTIDGRKLAVLELL